MILSVAVDSRLTNLLELSVNRVAIRNPDDWVLRVGDDEMMRPENSPPRCRPQVLGTEERVLTYHGS